MFKSVYRGLPRIAALVMLGSIFLGLAHFIPDRLGAIASPVLFGLGLSLVGLGAGDLGLRLLQPRVDATAAAILANRDGNVGAGLVYLGRCILASVILMLMVTASRAGEPPARALPLLPMLIEQQQVYWPSMPHPEALGAQVEQETCPSLTSRQCWSPTAELRTSREQGVGLGQLTRAFRADGSTRFDALAEIRQSFPVDLAGLSWENRYDPTLQLRALVLKDLQNYRQITGTSQTYERMAMTMAAYNGGMGGLASDRRACAGTEGCDPGVWFGHVERTSLKAKSAVPGYGKSFFAINREYVANVMRVRIKRYSVMGAQNG